MPGKNWNAFYKSWKWTKMENGNNFVRFLMRSLSSGDLHRPNLNSAICWNAFNRNQKAQNKYFFGGYLGAKAWELSRTRRSKEMRCKSVHIGKQIFCSMRFLVRWYYFFSVQIHLNASQNFQFSPCIHPWQRRWISRAIGTLDLQLSQNKRILSTFIWTKLFETKNDFGGFDLIL